VLVNDGQTVVLGGIMETERRDRRERKIPWLGDIPVTRAPVQVHEHPARSNNRTNS
jgi:type II secretory pathway component HofQ